MAVAVLSMILVSAMAGMTYQMQESTIDDIGSGERFTITETEDFESPDVNGSDPDSLANSASYHSWMYDYTESNWGTYDDIDNLTTMPLVTAGDQCYFVSGNTSGAYSKFVFKNSTNESCFRMNTFEMCFKVDNSTNDETNLSFFNCDDELIFSLIMRKNATNVTHAIVLNNAGTEIVNVTMLNNTWYKGKIEGDYTTDPYTYTFTAYKENIAGVWESQGTNTTTGDEKLKWINITAGGGDLWGTAYFDDMIFTYDSTTGQATAIRDAVKDAIIGGVFGLSTVGGYMPIIVMALVIFLVLGLIMALTYKSGTTGGKGFAGAL